MRLLFNWDSENSKTIATAQNVASNNVIERILRDKGAKGALRNHLVLNARLDELDAVEKEWWKLQKYIQSDDYEDGGELAARTALEVANPHLATYRGVAGPDRPDVSAAVINRLKGYARRWYIQKGEERPGVREVNVDGKTFVMDDIARRLIQDMCCLVAAGGTFANLKIKKTDGSYATLLGLAQAMSDESRTANSWIAGNIAGIDAAVTIQDVIDELS